MLTLSLFVRSERGSVGEEMGGDVLVMQVSLLSRAAAGLLALSPPALASVVEECRCHFGHPLVSISCSQLLTAFDRPAAQSLCSPEDTYCFFCNEWLISVFIINIQGIAYILIHVRV